MKNIEEIKAEYEKALNAEQAVADYTALIQAAPENDEPYVERGLMYWKLGKRAEAINDYNEAIRLNPNSRAVQVKSATYDILDFYNKDLFNP
ncbi:MAG: tetratricopeptide repeat protein [Prevotella sp.]|nr:tetratricopeptide repeat protein [Prevotella sp.]MCM1074241.1 tetratricopeptide repeat protein [Ruminococcus sp.]